MHAKLKLALAIYIDSYITDFGVSTHVITGVVYNYLTMFVVSSRSFPTLSGVVIQRVHMRGVATKY